MSTATFNEVTVSLDGLTVVLKGTLSGTDVASPNQITFTLSGPALTPAFGVGGSGTLGGMPITVTSVGALGNNLVVIFNGPSGSLGNFDITVNFASSVSEIVSRMVTIVDLNGTMSTEQYAVDPPVTVQFLCFHADTMIEGVPIYELKPGDDITLFDGTRAKIRKVHRYVDTKRFVSFGKGSLGNGVPLKTVKLTPFHGVIHRGRRYDSRQLINPKYGINLLKENADSYQIEIDGPEKNYSINVEGMEALVWGAGNPSAIRENQRSGNLKFAPKEEN
jgi:hypothetical protein